MDQGIHSRQRIVAAAGILTSPRGTFVPLPRRRGVRRWNAIHAIEDFDNSWRGISGARYCALEFLNT
jgi:hypothetical protein